MSYRWKNARPQRGFTLVEAMVALSITAMASAMLLLSTEGMLKATNDAVDQTIAEGMAAQLIDEVLGSRYCASDPYETSMTASAYETAGTGRERYNDTDDFNGYTSMPPKDRWGGTLGKGGEGTQRHPSLKMPGNDFAKWKQKIEVYYVSATNPGTRVANSQPTDYRAVEVTIARTESNGALRPLAKMRRVFCYVPIP